MPEFNDFPEIIPDDPPPAWLLEMVQLDQEMGLYDDPVKRAIKQFEKETESDA